MQHKLGIMTQTILLTLWVVLGWSYSVEATTHLNLVDISGSLADTKALFTKNMTVLNQTIDNTGTRDLFAVKCFRSHGNLWSLAEQRFPSSSGGRNRNLIASRNKLRSGIASGFRQPPVDIQGMGGSTDCIGALNQSLLWFNDQATTAEPVILTIYSDGLQTLGVGSLLHLKKIKIYDKRRRQVKNFLNSLKKKLDGSWLIKPKRLDRIVWYGALYSEDLGLSTTDLTSMESCLKDLWLTFLARELPETEVVYKLKY